MIKKYFLFLAAVLFFINIYAESVDIDIPDAEFVEQKGFVIPKISGYDLDGTGEEVILPFKKMVFASEIVKIEILKKHRITLEAPLKKGGELYRLSDMHRVAPGKRILPSISNFALGRYSTFKRDVKQSGFNLYPVIPTGEKEVIKIDRIRVTTKGKTLLPMTNTKSRNSLLILTTEYFLTDSQEISNFVEAKKHDGFRVDIATENSYGGGDLKGIKRVEKIREYLRSVYKDYDFLLIIAGTDPSGDEVPMVVTRPDDAEEPDYELVPTDIFYAELTEEMDSDRNGVYGERTDMISYAFELIVGRIPIYGKNVKNADKILARTVEFIKEKPSKAEYRQKILFPTTISYYKNQDNQFGIPKMDGAYVAEYLIKNSITEPFSTKILVEKSGLDPSEFVDEEALTYDSMLQQMNQSYGTVFWQAHGMPDYSVRTIWRSDRNGNGTADTYNYELYSDTFVDNDLMNKVNTVNPFVFQGSCLNGSIQSSGSLAFNTLKNTAVGVVGASQVSYGLIFSDYDLSSQDIFAYGAVFTDAIVKNEVPSQILFETKEKWSGSSVLLTIKLETNYLGDPSLKMNVQTCGSDSDCDDSIFCNGSEKCVDGFCEKASDALVCQDSENLCESNVCDETSRSCKKVLKEDGSLCGINNNLCFGGRQCRKGECVYIDGKDCSHLDNDCSEGVCDPETGACTTATRNEGIPCSSGKFCTKNEVCTNGICQGEAPDLPEAKACNKIECTEYGGFMNVTDSSQNWNDCSTENGEQGYCSYGICTPKQEQDKNSSSSSGCSLTIF